MSPATLTLTTVDLPAHFDTDALEDLIATMGPVPRDRAVVIDATEVRWVDPAAAVGLHVFGETVARGPSRPGLIPPAAPPFEASASALWLESAAMTFQLVTRPITPSFGPPDALVAPTRVQTLADVERTVDALWSASGLHVSRRLEFGPDDFAHLSMIVAELLNNVVDHAGRAGWFAAWMVAGRNSGDPPDLMLSVADGGRGFRVSQGARTDADGLTSAVVWRRSRLSDLGRGKGFKQIRSRLALWGGELTVRSGTARVVDRGPSTPVQVQTGLTHFEGAQVVVLIRPLR